MQKKSPRVLVTMRLPLTLKENLRRQADREGRSLTNMAMLVLMDGLKARQSQPAVFD